MARNKKTDFAIGTKLTVPILKTISIRGKSQYVVLIDDKQLRVPCFDSDPKDMIEVTCVVTSLNPFGFPSLDRVIETPTLPESKTVSIVQKEDHSLETGAVKKKVQKNKVKIIDVGSSDASEFEFPGYKKPQKHITIMVDEPETKKTIASDPVTYSAISETPKQETKIKKEKIVSFQNVRHFQEIPDLHDLSVYLWKEEYEDFKTWFIETGGLRRRYDILYLIARRLRDYHRQNLICGSSVISDFSVSLDPKLTISLPDTGSVLSSFYQTSVPSAILPPEVNLGRMPFSSLSDCFTFAVLVYQILGFCHPFVGDRVINGNEEDIFLAWTGKFPWIDSRSDNSNRRTHKYYDNFFITEELVKLLDQTFEQGLNDPLSRPTMDKWCDAFEKSYDVIVYCSHCNTHYLYDKEGCCTFCDTEPEHLTEIEVHRWFCSPVWNEEEQILEDKFIQEDTAIARRYLQNNGRSAQIWTNHLMIPGAKNKLLFELSISGIESHKKTLTVTPYNDCKIYVMSDTGVIYQKPISVKQNFVINDLTKKHFTLAVKPFDVEQRVVIIK